MKRHVIVILLTLALLGVLAFSVSAAPSTDPAELNKVNEAAVQMTFPTDGSNIRMTCPYCNENSLWLPLPAATGAKGLAGHYYLSGDMTANTGYYIPYNNNVCLNLNGYSIKTTNDYAIAGKADYEFNVMGNGNVEGKGSNAYGTVFGQGTIRLFGGAYTATSNYYVVSAYADNANVYMYDGATINGKPSATSAVVSTKASNFYFYGGTINTSGTAFYLTKGTTYLAGTTINAGGCGVYLPSGTAVIYHSAGTISGGTKRNIVMLAGTYNLTGGTISGGVTTGGNLSSLTATPGGNVAITGGTFNMESGTITGGKGCNVYVANGAFKMTGGTITKGQAATGTYVSGGNVHIASGTFTMEGGKITGGMGYTTGGNVHISDGTFTMTGGEISGGYVYTSNANRIGGGGVYMAGGTFDMQGGKVLSNVATGVSGGNFYVAGGELKLSTGAPVIQGGTANNGGNLYIVGGTAKMLAGTITGGTAALDGGNVFAAGGTFTLENGTITLGTANSQEASTRYYYYGGGNIYVGASGTCLIKGGTVSDGVSTYRSGGNILCYAGGTLTVSGGTISGGQAAYPGGNIMNGASKNVTISGGTITGGEGNTDGSQANDGDNITSFGGTLTISGGKIEANTDSLGNGVLGYYNAKIILDGAPTVNNIYLAYNTSKDATLQVNSTFTGTAGVNFHENHGIAVGKILELDSSTGPYTGKVYVENVSNITLYGTQDNKLQVAGTLANNTWYQNNETAMAAITGDATIKVYTSDALDLKGANYIVDLASNSPVITGTGNVTCIDSANKTFKNFGTATINGPTLVNTESTTQNGVLYLTVSEGNTHSFHILQAKVNSVSVRPSSAGVYYSCVWNCDSTLLEAMDIDSYGVALSVVDMPTENFMNDGRTMYTVVEGAFEPGNKRNSVLVDKILKTGADNQTRADMDIFAIPYVVINGKTVVGTGMEYSFKDIMNLMDRRETYFANRVALESFYETWESVMSSWNFTNIGKVSLDPTEDDTLRILMVGNSYCYYFAEELYALLAENKPEGIANVEVYNLYRGGCTLQEHYERWTGVQDSNYQLWKTDSTGRKLQGGGYTTTLEEALILENWDYISIQEGLSKFWFPTQEEVLAESKQYAEPIIDRIRQIHPNATLMWHETWSQEIGFSQERNGQTYTVTDAAAQTAYEAKEIYVAKQMCETYDLVRVNSGEAWTEARKSELITNLCARLGVNRFPEGTENSGDGFHDGDIGGGQLLNAYVWYMVITGDTTVTDTEYRPNYTLSEAVVEVLQAAAEAAIAAR